MVLSLIILFIVMVFLIILFIFLIFEMIKEKKRKQRCTAMVTAEVVGFTSVSFYDSENQTYYTKEAPLYEYSCNGELCRLAGSTDSKWVRKMKIGSQVEVFVDPDNPKSFFCPEEIRFVRRRNIKIVCWIIGFMLLVTLAIAIPVWYAQHALNEFGSYYQG